MKVHSFLEIVSLPVFLLLAVHAYLVVPQMFLDPQGPSLGCANNTDFVSSLAGVPWVDFHLKEILNVVKYFRRMFWHRFSI